MVFMKRIAFALAIVLTLCLAVAMAAILPTAAAGSVTVSGGDLASALNNVSDGGTVTINGTCTVASGFTWPSYTKNVTVTGGTLDLSAMGSTVKFNGNVTFENVTLTMTADATVYANGHKLTVKENVTVTNAVTAIYGGGASGTTVASTDLTLLSGDYKSIFGGSNGGTVSGDTNVVVGGNVNSACDWTSHTATYSVFGGSNGGTIGGDTHMTFTGSAKANYIWGGSKGSGAKINGDKYATMSGGSTMSFYGGNNGVDTGAGSTNYTVLSGGQLQQLFGGNQSASMTGDVYLRVLGGTVTRRIYGGCYNNFTTELGLGILAGKYGKWDTTYQVTGNITLIIGDNANITFSLTSENDRAVYATSRLSTHNNTGALPANENSKIIFLNTYKSSLLGAQDSIMQKIMSTISAAADEIHTVTHTVSGTTVTQTCNGSGHDKDGSSATAANAAHTATLTLSASADSFTYTGSPIRPVTATYSDGWLGDTAEVIYQNNVNVGTATASVTCNGLTVSLPFAITKIPSTQSAPTNYLKTDETIRGKGDGQIIVLDSGMEWSADGDTYHTFNASRTVKVTGGTYYVRYAAQSVSHEPSPATTVVVNAGAPLVVTFKANGQTVDTREVDWDATLTDLPEVPAKEGYNGAWKTDDLTGIREDVTVEAKYTIKSYTITFKANGITVTTKKVNHGASLTAIPAVPEKAGHTGVWDTTVFDTVTGDMTVNAVYTANTYTVTFKIDGETVATETVTHGSAVSAPTLPAKAGFTAAWSVADLSAVTEDLVVEAVYTPITYTVTFMADGAVVATKTVEQGAALTAIPQVPVKVGYTGVWDTTDFDTVTGDMTVNAVYTALPSAEMPEEEIPEDEAENTDEENTAGSTDDADLGEEGSPVVLIVLIAVGACAVIGGVVAVTVIKKKKKA